MIPYTYEIISVDQQARVMEVVYSSPGRQTMHISARLPFVGESLEAVIQMFSRGGPRIMENQVGSLDNAQRTQMFTVLTV